MNQTIVGMNGFLGENALSRAIASSPQIKPLKFDSRELINIAKSTPIGRSRLESAEPFLLKEFGVPVPNKKHQSNKLGLDWETLPYTMILDYVFGLDQVISFRGWHLGIDATTNVDAIDEKLAKLRWLKPLWSRLELDRTVVCHVCQTGNDLLTSLRSILQGSSTIQLAM
jgi:hypothetical protein